MARDLSFPRTRHVALSYFGQEQAKAEGAEAILLPTRSAEGEPRAGMPLPEPVQPGAPGVPAKGDLPAAADAPALSTGVQPAAPQPRDLPRVVIADVAQPKGSDECATIEGKPAQVRCVSSLEGLEHSLDAATLAAELGEAVLLDGVGRWYEQGPKAAGYCRSCEAALLEELRESYGDHFEPFEVLPLLRDEALAPLERPFARVKEGMRLSQSVAAAKRAVLSARDAARRERSLEMAVLGKVGRVDALAVLLCAHLDGLIFELPSPDPYDALLPLAAARAALGSRPAVALLPRDASKADARLLTALSTACDCDVLLPEGAGPEARAAVAAHRKFMAVVRQRFRPSHPLADAEILLSPHCDHWTMGEHAKLSATCLAHLARAQLHASLRLDLSQPVAAPLLVLAGASSIAASDAATARRFVEGGGDALVLGRCSVSDEEGRQGDPVFREVKSGLERVGEGRVYAIDGPALVPRALRELGRRPQVLLAGRGRLLARAYLDGERKLDVHLVNLDPAPAQGVQLTIAGQAAGGGRSGYWFAEDRQGGPDGERITLNPSGFSVSTILPSIDTYALLTVPR